MIDALTVDNASETTAQITVSAAPVGARVFLFVDQSPTPPANDADFQNGKGADWAINFQVPALPTGTPGATGLTAATDYHVHAMVVIGDTRAYASQAFSTMAIDTTAPNLTSLVIEIIDESSATLSVETDRADGLLYIVATVNEGLPDKAQMRAGEDSRGARPAHASVEQAVNREGPQTVTATGLSEVLHYAYGFHESAAGFSNDPVFIGSFTPTDVKAPVLSSLEVVANGSDTATLLFNLDTAGGDVRYIVQPDADPAPDDTTIDAADLYTVTGGSPHSIMITGLVPNTAYRPYAKARDAAGNQTEIIMGDGPAKTRSDKVTGWTLNNRGLGYTIFVPNGGSYTAAKTAKGGVGRVYSNPYFEAVSGQSYVIEIVTGAATRMARLTVALSEGRNPRSTSKDIRLLGAGTYAAIVTAGSSGTRSILHRTSGLGYIEVISSSVRAI